MNSNNRVVRATFVVFGFWWLLLTLYAFGGSPLEVIASWDNVSFGLSRWFLGCFAGAVVGVWMIWFSRVTAINKIFKGKSGLGTNGIHSTLGDVPTPAGQLKRVDSSSKRLPIASPALQKWIAKAQSSHPKHLALFYAIWDTYSAHKHFPASHRKGGHGNRRLHEHCLAVADLALNEAKTYVYEGVFIKLRGKPKFQIIAPRNSDYVFDHEDPLIPIIMLAHDIGKLEAYTINPDGSVQTREEGGETTPQDDTRVFHDSLGARILARFPEYWQLDARDRRALNLVIAHYHHPSAFPIDRNGLSLEDRMTALMEFLILMDKKTGVLESGITTAADDQEYTEDESGSIYHAFVELITQHGRVNGVGDKSKDSTLKIGQKHDGLIVIKEKDLRLLILGKLGWSVEDGAGRYRMTQNLLSTLSDKGVLYSFHNHVDFKRYLPMYSAVFRDARTGAHITTWEPTIIIKPVSTTPELSLLSGLPNQDAKLEIERPLFTHNLGIGDADMLRQLISNAFNDEIAAKTTIPARSMVTTTPGASSIAATPDPAQPVTASPVPSIVPGETPVSPPVALVQSAVTVGMVEPAQAIDHPEVIQTSAAEPTAIEPTVQEEDHEPDAPEIPEIPEMSEVVDQPVPEFDDDAFSAFVGSTDTDDDDGLGSFADFDESAPGAPTSTESLSTEPVKPEPDELNRKADEKTVQELGGPTSQQLPLDGIAVVDPDAMPNRRRKSAAEEAEALASLANFNLEFQAFVPTRKRKTPAADLSRLQNAARTGAIPICGTRDGFDYLLQSDVIAFAVEIDLPALIKSKKLPTATPTEGVTLIGIPTIV
ncbi:hypothetical protein [Pseudomonas lactis]|uniref:hypothetical protein n=1 Tax=Pseudomonas lactis TaxID=1615674 RepID=UPI003F80B2DD